MFPMRVLINDYGGYSFSAQLSRALSRRGHQVLHLYAGNNVTPRGTLRKSGQDPATFDIHPIYIKQPLQKYSFIRRFFQEREYGRLLSKEILAYKPDVMISADTPLDAQNMALQSSQKIGAHFIFWLQDFLGLATNKILSKKITVLGALVGKYYIGLERSIARQSDRIVTITDDFIPLLSQWGVSREKINVIPNWASLEEIGIKTKHNSWAERHGLADKFVFLYTGNLGMKHNPNLLFRLGQAFLQNPEVRVVVISKGLGADWLKKKAGENFQNNIVLFDYQPTEMYSDVLGTGDILLTILESDAGLFSVPSKVLSYLCACRPQLLAVPSENLAARTVSQNDAGLVVPPEDLDAYVSAAKNLMEDGNLRQRCAQNGRQYAEEHFDIEQITTQFESFLF